MACRRAVSVLAPLLALTASGATELPAFNLAAGRTNPLKGLMAYSPDKDADTTLDCVPNTLEFMYVGVHHLMSSLTDFDFEHLEELLDSTASRHKHAVVRFIFDFPGEPDEYEVPTPDITVPVVSLCRLSVPVSLSLCPCLCVCLSVPPCLCVSLRPCLCVTCTPP
jgi:hypothetical protein